MVLSTSKNVEASPKKAEDEMAFKAVLESGTVISCNVVQPKHVHVNE